MCADLTLCEYIPHIHGDSGRLRSPSEKVLVRFSLCIERVFIYDQYLLTQSASQVRWLFETRSPGVKIPSCSTVHNPYNKFQAMGSVESKKQHKPHSIFTEETLEDISHRLEQSPSKSLRHLLQQVGIYGRFYKEVLKMYGQRRWTVPVPPSIKLVSMTICKIVTEMCVVVSPWSYAVCSLPRTHQQCTVKSLLLLSTLVPISLCITSSNMTADSNSIETGDIRVLKEASKV